MKSTPANPLTWRSTKPGAATPRPWLPAQPDGGDQAAVDLDVARDERPVDERSAHAEPHPFTAPAVVPRIRCLRRMMNTITTGSV